MAKPSAPVAALRSGRRIKTSPSGGRARGKPCARELARARRRRKSAGRDSAAEGASAPGSGSSGVLLAERGLRGPGKLGSRGARAERLANRASSNRPSSSRTKGGVTRSVSGWLRRARVLRLNRPARASTEPGSREHGCPVGPTRSVRDGNAETTTQLAAAAPTAPRLEVGSFCRGEICGGSEPAPASTAYLRNPHESAELESEQSGASAEAIRYSGARGRRGSCGCEPVARESVDS